MAFYYQKSIKDMLSRVDTKSVHQIMESNGFSRLGPSTPVVKEEAPKTKKKTKK